MPSSSKPPRDVLSAADRAGIEAVRAYMDRTGPAFFAHLQRVTRYLSPRVRASTRLAGPGPLLNPVLSAQAERIEQALVEPSAAAQLHALAQAATQENGVEAPVLHPAHLTALQAAVATFPPDFPPPQAFVAPDGEVGVYWQGQDRFAELSIAANGSFSLSLHVRGELETGCIAMEGLRYDPTHTAALMAHLTAERMA